MTRIVQLCSDDDCCPRVELDADEVRIGEEGNLVRLKPAEWKALRERILQGEL